MKTFKRVIAVLAVIVMSGANVPGQTLSTGRVMREKLAHSQKILEAIMTSDFASLDRESRELERATESPAWSAFSSPEYLRQGAAFLRATADLREAAKGRDLDAAALHYMSLTLSCFECHRYMKNSRITRR
jgi:hypothetical protein